MHIDNPTAAIFKAGLAVKHEIAGPGSQAPVRLLSVVLLAVFVSGCASWEPTRYPDNPTRPDNPWPAPDSGQPTPQPGTEPPPRQGSGQNGSQTGQQPVPSGGGNAGNDPKSGQSPVPPAGPRPVPPRNQHRGNAAVVSLKKQAAGQVRGGELEKAASSLERALRIAPDDAELWQQLAAVRIGQNRLSQTEGLLHKSNSLAAGDIRLQSINWRLISEVRKQQGNNQGAGEALREARRLESSSL